MSEEQMMFAEGTADGSLVKPRKGSRKKDPNAPPAPKRMTNLEVSERYDMLEDKVVEAICKMDDVAILTSSLNERLDQMMAQISTAPRQPAPAPEKPAGSGQMMPGPTGFREGPAPAETAPVQERPAETAPGFVTSREMFDSFSKQLARKDGELANKSFASLVEKLCYLREDYNKLCDDIESNISVFSAAQILGSFKAYLVDLENMLTDAKVEVGPYGKDGDRVNVMHQRIVKVIPTTDPTKDETIAERLADGYEFGGKAIIKEKVNVYKLAEPAPAQNVTGFREAP